jgi:hypothetical protein
MTQPHSAAECIQTPALTALSQTIAAQGQTQLHILDSLKRLDAHGERTAAAMERMAENSATIEAQTKRLDQHDTAFIELFNWRRNFVEKQDGDYRNNLDRIVALEKHVAVDGALEEVAKEKDKFWTDVKIKLIGPILTGALFVLYVADKTGLIDKLFDLWSEFAGK